LKFSVQLKNFGSNFQILLQKFFVFGFWIFLIKVLIKTFEATFGPLQLIIWKN